MDACSFSPKQAKSVQRAAPKKRTPWITTWLSSPTRGAFAASVAEHDALYKALAK